MLENELYEPMRVWLEQYLKDKYKGYEIITLDTSQERLDRALKRYDIINDMVLIFRLMYLELLGKKTM